MKGLEPGLISPIRLAICKGIFSLAVHNSVSAAKWRPDSQKLAPRAVIREFIYSGVGEGLAF